MLKNELEILTTIQNRQVIAGQIAADLSSGFSEHLKASCDRVRDAWTAAAFSAESDTSIRRYFDFHFKFLSGLIMENDCDVLGELSDELYKLMDYLLHFYRVYIDQLQSAPRQYCAYRLRLNEPGNRDMLERLQKMSISLAFKTCLAKCLSPLYLELPADDLTIGALFYRERLVSELDCICRVPALLTDENLIALLIALNFNHLHFMDFLRERVMAALYGLPLAEREKRLLELSLAIPAHDSSNTLSFDSNWPSIGAMYKEWLNGYRALCNLGGRTTVPPGLPFAKLPLNISVKHLACMIRALYSSGFYGSVSLSAIFDHSAAVFVTKKQDQISADSLSNAYYSVDQSSAAKTIGIFDSASRVLRSCYFPG
ncbi:hypothetical protein [Mucilaginibacter gossypii]|uniref:Uncharacterized protein n=1 Tax=Mucilaginibacter gossypii TaxID=551996 RepID=A0A1G8A433_9SPHI|nr:hypothetical protein [Mucilaginibacter gossypii]SDH15623.1 hypothetical protein SAMN05192573_10785 [Mucilaginibacter gossypii]